MTALELLAERVSAGDRITEADARVLLDTHDLLAVGAMADDVRRRWHGTRTTFVRVFDVHVDAPPASLPAGLAAGEIRIVGTPASLGAAVAVVSRMRELAGTIPLTGFSLADLTQLHGSIREIAATLHEAGLHALAEVPVDQVAGPALMTDLHAGGLAAYRLTVQSYGDVPPAAMVQRAADIQAAVGGFHAFAPLPRLIAPTTPTTGYDDVKLVAIARLMLEIASIQVDWRLYGPKLAQVALTMGADDVDGIAAFDTASLGTRRSAIAEITGNIRAAAQDPVERNGRFESLE